MISSDTSPGLQLSDAQSFDDRLPSQFARVVSAKNWMTCETSR